MSDDYDMEDVEEEELDTDEDEAGDDDEFAVARTRTNPAIDFTAVGHRIEVTGIRSQVGRSLLVEIMRMEQLLGDADATFADLASDIEASIRLFFTELEKNPTVIFMDVLSGMSARKQRQQIAQMLELLQARLVRLDEQDAADAIEAATSELGGS